MHKSTGWKFIYTSGQSIFKTSIWAKEYALDEEKPQLTYEANERKSLKRRVVILQGGSTLLTFIMFGFIAWNLNNHPELFNGSFYHYFLLVSLAVAIPLQLYNFSRVIRYALKG